MVVGSGFFCQRTAATAVPITYVNLDGSSFGTGSALGGFESASVISSSNLDASAFLFEIGDQIVWERGAAPESTTHYVTFDYFAAASTGANITFFLDVPLILRFDFDAPGRHNLGLAGGACLCKDPHRQPVIGAGILDRSVRD